MKLTKAVESFIKETTATKSSATATAYDSDLRRLIVLAGHDTVLAFTEELVRRYFVNASEAGLSMATLHRRRASLNEFGKWGVRNRLWLANPVEVMAKIRRPHHVPRPFSHDESERLLRLELPPMERVIRAILFLTGLRVSPICGIKVGDISFDPPTIRALVKGAKVQIVRMHPELKELLYSYVLAATDLKPQTWLLRLRSGRPLRRRQIERICERWGTTAGVPGCSPHRFRHSYATGLLEAGVDIRLIKDAMGHADIQSTMVYTEVNDARLDEAIGRLKWKP